MASAAQKDEAGWGGRFDRAETWDEFDMLPRGVKRLYWEAPYQYTAVSAVRAFTGGLNMRALAKERVQSMARDVRRETLRLYGRTHPQARTGRW